MGDSWRARLSTLADLARIAAHALAAAAADAARGRVRVRDAAQWDYLWRRYVYGPNADCWDRPLGNAPSHHALVVGRDASALDVLDATLRPCINLGSYNYLGWEHGALGGAPPAPAAAALAAHGCAPDEASTRALEAAVARFVGKEAALVFATGFSTNAGVLAALFAAATPDDACEVDVFSDALNHASIVTGLRAAAARGRVRVHVFAHGDAAHLARLLARLDAAARRRAWVVVEGVYSMEGDVCPLAALVALRAQHGCRLYVDEAHSIGALGAHGRGVCEHFNVAPASVDVLMGTFTKAFAACGGYVAADARLVDALRRAEPLCPGDAPLSAVCAAHVCSVLQRLATPAGAARVARLHAVARALRTGLRARGYVVLGDDASPVVPLLTHGLLKMCALSRRCLAVHGVALVVVGYPATSVWGARVRVCASAAHTDDDVSRALAALDEAARAAGVPRLA